MAGCLSVLVYLVLSLSFSSPLCVTYTLLAYDVQCSLFRLDGCCVYCCCVTRTFRTILELSQMHAWWGREFLCFKCYVSLHEKQYCRQLSLSHYSEIDFFSPSFIIIIFLLLSFHIWLTRRKNHAKFHSPWCFFFDNFFLCVVSLGVDGHSECVVIAVLLQYLELSHNFSTVYSISFSPRSFFLLHSCFIRSLI